MAKMTVLDIVQATLTSMGSDEVNTIDATPEAYDVAHIVRDCYFNIINSKDWPHLRRVISPTPFADPARPTHMNIEDPIQKIANDTMYYDVREDVSDDPEWRLIKYLELDDFMKYTMSRSTALSDSNVDLVVDPSGFRFYIYNDRGPTYYTSVDDETLIFDSYDSTVEASLQNDKAQVTAYKEPTFSVTDTHVPDLPSKIFPYLLAEVKSVASIEIAQTANPKQEQTSRAYKGWMALEKWRTRGGIRNLHNFGRK